MRDKRRAIRVRVGRNVRDFRLLRGLSQEDLAESAKTTSKYIGQIERGEVNVSLDVLASIAGGLSVNVTHLFDPRSGDAAALCPYAVTPPDLAQLEHALRVVVRIRRGARRRARAAPGRSGDTSTKP